MRRGGRGSRWAEPGAGEEVLTLRTRGMSEQLQGAAREPTGAGMRAGPETSSKRGPGSPWAAESEKRLEQSAGPRREPGAERAGDGPQHPPQAFIQSPARWNRGPGDGTETELKTNPVAQPWMEARRCFQALGRGCGRASRARPGLRRPVGALQATTLDWRRAAGLCAET